MHTPAQIAELSSHADWVRALARELVRDEHRAEDVVQETWVAALRRPPRDDSNVRGWLATVVRNVVRGRARANVRRIKSDLPPEKCTPGQGAFLLLGLGVYSSGGRSQLGRRVRQHRATAEKGRDDLPELLLHGVKANLVAFRVQEVREEPKVIAYLCLRHNHRSTCLLRSCKHWRQIVSSVEVNDSPVV